MGRRDFRTFPNIESMGMAVDALRNSYVSCRSKSMELRDEILCIPSCDRHRILVDVFRIVYHNVLLWHIRHGRGGNAAVTIRQRIQIECGAC